MSVALTLPKPDQPSAPHERKVSQEEIRILHGGYAALGT
jgi:hypothetical protein